MISFIRREFTRNRTSFIVYCVIAVCSAWMYISLFPSIEKQSAQLDEIMKSFPPAMMKAFGIDKAGFTTVERFLSTELMSFIWPILSILFLVSRAGASIAGSIENRTLGLEISMPLSRTRLYMSKFFGQLLALCVFCVVSIPCIIPLCVVHDIDVDVSNIFSLTLLCFLFGLSVMSFSLCISAATSDKGHVYFTLGGVLFVSFVANIVANISTGFSWLKHFSIFNYFSSFDVLTGESISATSYAFFLCVAAISTVAGLLIFRRRDLPV